MDWTNDIEKNLDALRLNSLIRSMYHKNNYFKMSARLKYFRIPIIILSGINSVFTVALSPMISQETISLLCCFISLSVGLIGSIELFLQIQKNMEIDLLNSKEFYLIAIDITKILALDRVNRVVSPLPYLDEKFNQYKNLIDSSVIIDKTVYENLLALDLINNLTPDDKIEVITNNTSVKILNESHKKNINNINEIKNEIIKDFVLFL